MRVTTYLSSCEYERFKKRANQLNKKEYQFAKEAILEATDQPAELTRMKCLLIKVAKDLEETKLF